MSRPNRTIASGADIQQLIERRRPGFSLEAPFYISQEVFDADLEAIFWGHWLFCATEAEIPEAGDYVTIDIGPASVIIVRDDGERVGAFHNVCRHRGSRILSEPCGSVGNLVCPYHQWTYRTDGQLAFAENQAAGFEKSRFGLRPVHVRTLAGLIFVCLADGPPGDFAEVAARIEPYLAPYRLGEATVAHQIDIVEQGNWKLVMENNRECHHCDIGHPELLSAYFPFNRSGSADVTPRMQALFERFESAGEQLRRVKAKTRVPCEPHRELDTRPTGFTIDHLPLDGAGSSFAAGGGQLSRKLLGEIPQPEFGDLYLHFQPNAWLHFLSDHAVVFRVLPLGPDRSLVRSTWLVHADAIEGVDYEVEALTAVWRATNDQDRAFVERCQQGVADPGYEPGPYGRIEDDVEAFVNWYVWRMRVHFGHAREAVRPTGAELTAELPSGASMLECWSASDTATLECQQVQQITHDVKSFHFSAGDGSVFTFEPGQFVTLDLDLGQDPIQRCYTISSPPTRPQLLSITVKRAPGGPVSNWLHDNVVPGTRLRVKAPLGSFTLPHPTASTYLFLSAGSGITPLMSMTRTVFDLGLAADIAFVHSARTPADIIFRAELAAIAAVLPGIRVTHICEDDAPGERWSGLRGRLSAARLRAWVPDVGEREVFTCGPAPYMASVRAMLSELGCDPRRYHEESFSFERHPRIDGFATASPAPRSAKPVDVASFDVEFVRSGVTVAARADQSLLEAAWTAGLTWPSACTQGICGSCKTTTLEGQVEMRHQGGFRPREIAQGTILMCCSTPLSDLRIDG